MKKEKFDRAFRSLRTAPADTINLDSPSPKKNEAASSTSELPPAKRAKCPPNPEFSVPHHEPDELEQELERIMDEADNDERQEMDIDE